MTLKARLIQTIPMKTGVSKSGKDWKSQDIILETEGQYSTKVCVTFFGEKSAIIGSIPIGREITVHFEPESREHSGKWYTKLNGWKIETGTNQASPARNLASAPSSEEDLPF